MTPKRRIPVYEPLLGQQERELLDDCIRSGWISSIGKYIPRFERQFARFCDCSHAAAVSSGTAALHLTLAALGIGRGDEVIVPSLTFVATANSVSYTGAKVVLVDVTEDTWTINPEQVESAITPRTKAVIAVHLYGHPCDMRPLLAITRPKGIKVIEDAAEAHGAEYSGKRVGSLGDAGCFSFYGNKVITTGEGGMVVTNDAELDSRVRFLRDHSMDAERRYFHPEIGYNYRMTNVQAAIGCAQMKRINAMVRTKRTLAQAYSERLRDIEGLLLPPEKEWAKSVYWLYTVVLERAFGISSAELARRLASAGIDTRPVFIPMHQLPMYATRRRFPVSERLSRNGLSLPSSPSLREKDIDHICGRIRRGKSGGMHP
ncbi:MAG: DegT/DnrJ/EryC1/StrS family aminotransferase [Candidatus Abyssobacteria bacterium SURF_17]|uniref:GDP-perosamine synthase n=1 Tax=Candidatus Abyssobacteria bacterium SURF_17 TaxID=2093361 RepID=A0A419F4W2_9BACT|nr:MAG: DegT/DnrJ/EryC1/StrS family aminotransferase [Candidatus Abyssubacteria bacterium SURF_17]